jgi:hypothetical protein
VSGPRSEATFSVPWEWLEAVSRRAAEIVLEQKPIAVEAASPYLTITEAAEYCRLLNPAEAGGAEEHPRLSDREGQRRRDPRPRRPRGAGSVRRMYRQGVWYSAAAILSPCGPLRGTAPHRSGAAPALRRSERHRSAALRPSKASAARP